MRRIQLIKIGIHVCVAALSIEATLIFIALPFDAVLAKLNQSHVVVLYAFSSLVFYVSGITLCRWRLRRQ